MPSEIQQAVVKSMTHLTSSQSYPRVLLFVVGGRRTPIWHLPAPSGEMDCFKSPAGLHGVSCAVAPGHYEVHKTNLGRGTPRQVTSDSPRRSVLRGSPSRSPSQASAMALARPSARASVVDTHDGLPQNAYRFDVRRRVRPSTVLSEGSTSASAAIAGSRCPWSSR